MTFKKIYIIGAGAIGKTLAVFLQQAGNDVVLLRGQVDEVADTMEAIEIKLDDGLSVKAEIRVSTISNYTNLDGIVVVACKSYGNDQIAERLKSRIGNCPVVILQNGLNVESAFVDRGFGQVYRCVLFATCQQISDNVIRYKPVSSSPVGVVCGDKDILSQIIHQFDNPYFTFRAESNILPTVWTKTIANCVFNSVCPLLETDNGIFHRDEKALVIAKRIIAECVAVAATQGVFLETEVVLDRLLQISRSSDGQLISTYQDILNRRKTEIQTLNLAVAGIAAKINQHSLAAETRLLGELVEIKSGL